MLHQAYPPVCHQLHHDQIPRKSLEKVGTDRLEGRNLPLWQRLEAGWNRCGEEPGYQVFSFFKSLPIKKLLDVSDLQERFSDCATRSFSRKICSQLALGCGAGKPGGILYGKYISLYSLYIFDAFVIFHDDSGLGVLFFR